MFTNHENEWWISHPRFQNHEFSTHGRIRNKQTKRILSPCMDRDGYLVVSLGNVDNLFVHRLIAEAFLGIPNDSKMQVNHINNNRADNFILNLEWVTPRENVLWGVHHGNIDPMKGLAIAREVNLTPVRIVELDRIFSSVKECAEFLGVLPNSVSRVLTGIRKGQLLHGYHIEYV